MKMTDKPITTFTPPNPNQLLWIEEKFGHIKREIDLELRKAHGRIINEKNS